MHGLYAVFHKQIGDLVLLEPALRKLSLARGGPVRLMTRSGHRDVVRLMEHVEYCPGLAWRPERLLIAYDPLPKTALRSALAPAARKICILPNRREAGRHLPFVFREVSIPELGDEYIAEYFWRHTPGGGGAFEPPRLLPPPREWRPACAPTAPFVLLHPTAGWRKKSWTPEGWAAVNDALAAEGLQRVMTYGGQDWQMGQAQDAARLAKDAPILAGATSLREFLWLCASARLVVTVDGAASHLASAFGVPALTLFGPTPVVHWHRPSPRSVALVADASRDGKRRLRNLPPAPVLHAMRELMAVGLGD